MPQEDIEKLLAALEDKVWVSIERTVQTDDFEPIRISMGESRTVGPDNNPDELRMQICRKLLQDAIQEGENVRANFEKYLRKEDSAPQGPITGTEAENPSSTIRRKRRI